MDEERPGASGRHALLHTVLRLAALVAAGLAVPVVLDHLGVRDVSWAPPEYGGFVEPADPDAPHADATRTGAAEAPPDRDGPGRQP